MKFLTPSFGGVNLTKESATMKSESPYCGYSWDQLVLTDRCPLVFGLAKRIVSYLLCPSNAVSCRVLGEAFSFLGLNGGDVCQIDHNCYQIHVLNNITNYGNLKTIYWREIGHFAELRYFWPSA